MPDVHSFTDELILHQKQRDEGRSVLSVLVGPVDVSLSAWKRFAGNPIFDYESMKSASKSEKEKRLMLLAWIRR